MLCATEGAGTVHQREHLADARLASGRIVVRHYELVQLPRRGDTARWTWRLPMERYRELMETTARLARREHQGAAQDFLDTQLKRPGFNGVRTQTYAILRVMRTEGRRAGREPLKVPEQIAWVRASFRRCEPLGAWLAQERVQRALKHLAVAQVGDAP